MTSIENRLERSARFQKNINFFIEYYENHQDSMSEKEIVAYRKVAEVVRQQIEILSEGIEKQMKLRLKLAKKKEAGNKVLRKAVEIGLEALAQAEAKKGKIDLLEISKNVLSLFKSFINKS